MVQYKSDDTQLLISLPNSKGQNFILKISVLSRVLKILVTDKATAERWKCTFDSNYIENLTHKTGNFKQFSVFVSMLKAGLLKTNECVYVELVTQDELENRRQRGTNGISCVHRNRKYLILIYQVQFDKIHYPLPLEYCGKPDPEVLQLTIRKLENDMSQIRSDMAKQMMNCKTEYESREISLQNIVTQLNTENKILYEENKRLRQQLSQRNSERTDKHALKLEAQLRHDRDVLSDRIYRLEIENKKLTSILTGRASRSHVPVYPDKIFNRSTSLPRSSSSYHYGSGDGRKNKKRSSKTSPSPSPTRKPFLSHSDKSALSIESLKIKQNSDRRKCSNSSDGRGSQIIKNASPRRIDKNRSQINNHKFTTKRF